MNTNVITQVGGIFTILVFWHFFADWVFQTHKEAMSKSKNAWIRARHCVIYTLLFWPLFLLCGFHGEKAGMATFILFATHFIIDSYVPVMLWAKYLRRAPQFQNVGTLRSVGQWQDNVVEQNNHLTDTDAFVAFVQTPLGLVLTITMDQFLHIACLGPVAWMMAS